MLGPVSGFSLTTTWEDMLFLRSSNRWPSNVHLCRRSFSKYVSSCATFFFELQKSILTGLVPQNCCGILLCVSAAIQVYPSHDGGGPERGQPAFEWHWHVADRDGNSDRPVLFFSCLVFDTVDSCSVYTIPSKATALSAEHIFTSSACPISHQVRSNPL